MTGKRSSRRRGRWCEIVFAETALGAEQAEPDTRFGISITRKAGNSVRRNRLKRIIREFLRNNKRSWPENKMVVIRIKAPVTDEADLVAELEDMLKNLE
jgi:ribonuclease P protein component